MIVVYPFFPGDEQLALKNALWMAELGGCKGHDVLMLHDTRCVMPEQIRAALDKSFDNVIPLVTETHIDGWPEGANHFFRLATCWLQNKKWPHFLWLEPDAIPLKEGWLEDIVREFDSVARKMGKHFMGDRVAVEDIPLHMSGVGIYPNPLHAYAGEAYRAFEIAWDMAAKDQIVPAAHWTKLIEHAWKHPKFTSNSELATQIRPECVLFHSSKDGSLIDLLRRGRTETPDTPFVAGQAGSTPVAATYRPPDGMFQGKPTKENPTGEYVCDIFIRTYPGDYQWLDYCLRSIAKYCRGFRKLWIISPQPSPQEIIVHGVETEWKQMNDETEDGYLAQQITKLYADTITDYQADYIMHVDSDVLFTRDVTPADFFDAIGQLIWYYTPYESIRTPWQPVIEKFMQFTQPYEFMRRLPIMIPRWLYPRLREFCHKIHGRVISEYIMTQPPREFSEFNALGAYAYFHHREKFHWVDTTLEATVGPCARQFHSWGGLTPEVKAEIDSILQGGEVVSRSAHNQEIEGSIPSPAIKTLSDDLWVLEGDQISNWVEQEGRLDHDQNFLPKILPHIKQGDCVIDIGAHIGDHTIAYVRAAGVKGVVHAFEPNPMSFKCLTHNVSEAVFYNVALGNKNGDVPLDDNNGQPSGAWIGEGTLALRLRTPVKVRKLDDYSLSPDFIKIDVEGYEPHVLDGAQETIEKHHPVMVIEVNQSALERQGFKASDIFWRLESYGYEYKIMQENCNPLSPMYDILCVQRPTPPAQSPPETAVASPPVAAPLRPWDEVCERVDWLRAFADQSPNNKRRVMVALVHAKLKEPKYKPRKKKNETTESDPKHLPEKA